MDPITHGIAGSLLGKSFFSKRTARVGIFAATFGAVVPDIDVAAGFVSRDPLALVKFHRGITHSFVALPVFAFVLAWLTRRIAPKFGFDTPSLPMLTLIYGTGIASHILMDGTTSFGTRMWTPISSRRVAWDLIFIVDLVFTAILLLPQVIAWIYSDAERSRQRAIRMWIVFTIAAAGAWAVALGAGFPFHAWIVAMAGAIFALLFFLPDFSGRSSWGFRVTRAQWCSGGVFAALVYVFVCGLAHRAAFQEVLNFARSEQIPIVRIGALPLAPSVLTWTGGIRTNSGTHESRFDLRNAGAPSFEYFSDSQGDPNVARAMSLPDVGVFWNFARFPTIRSRHDDGMDIVDIGEDRLTSRRRGPPPFMYRIVFDGTGNILEQGMSEGGAFRLRVTH